MKGKSFALAVCVSSFAVLAAISAAGADDPTPPQTPLPLVPGAKVVILWPPGSLKQPDAGDKETFKFIRDQPGHVLTVTDVHNPSIELHLAPAEKANGTGIIIAPGGGNRRLMVGTEGTEVAAWLNSVGASAFVLRYRVLPYRSDVEAMADTQRAVRMVRTNAKEWGVAPDKIGVMGFSAGGEQAARVALHFDAGNPGAADPVEKASDRPDFVVLAYPGGKEVDFSHVPTNAPPAFLMCAGIDDAPHAKLAVDFYNAFFNAQRPVELHIYGHGGHGFGVRPRNGIPMGTWQYRFVDWAADLGLMKKPE